MSAHTRTRGLMSAQANGNVIASLNEAFTEFKRKQGGEVSGMQAAIDKLNSDMVALRIGGAGSPDDVQVNSAAYREAQQFVASYMRTGRVAPNAAMSTDSNPDGGYTVDRVLSDKIARKTFDASPLARLARRETITVGDAFEEPIDVGDIGAEWVGERQSRPALDTTSLKMLSVPVPEIYTTQTVTQRLLDDSKFDIAGWMNSKIADKFSRSEGAAFVSGDGINKPRGFLTYDTSTAADSARDWWTMQHINTGVSGAFATASTSASPADALFNTVYSLRTPYRSNARWLMNLATAGIVRKFKDPDGAFIWGDARQGQPASLCGFPVELDEEMPDIGADSLSIAFGDFEQAYIVVDKPGIRLLRDPYTAKPHVLFYAYRRIGGGLQNGEAVKLVRFGTA